MGVSRCGRPFRQLLCRGIDEGFRKRRLQVHPRMQHAPMSGHFEEPSTQLRVLGHRSHSRVVFTSSKVVQGFDSLCGPINVVPECIHSSPHLRADIVEMVCACCNLATMNTLHETQYSPRLQLGIRDISRAC